MAEFGLVDSFGVDHGELDGLRPAECFTLGVEWEMFRQQLLLGKPFKTLCNVANTKRLEALAERHGHYVETYPEHEGWTEVVVGDKKT